MSSRCHETRTKEIFTKPLLQILDLSTFFQKIRYAYFVVVAIETYVQILLVKTHEDNFSCTKKTELRYVRVRACVRVYGKDT